MALAARNLFDKTYVSSCLAQGDCFYGDRRTVNLTVARKFYPLRAGSRARRLSSDGKSATATSSPASTLKAPAIREERQ